MNYYQLGSRHLLVTTIVFGLIALISFNHTTGVDARYRCCKRRCCDLLNHIRDKRDTNSTVFGAELKANASINLEDPIKPDVKEKLEHFGEKVREVTNPKSEHIKTDDSKSAVSSSVSTTGAAQVTSKSDQSAKKFEEREHRDVDSRRDAEPRKDAEPRRDTESRKEVESHREHHDNDRDSDYYRHESRGSPHGCDPSCVKSSLLYSDCTPSHDDEEAWEGDPDDGYVRRHRRRWWRRCYRRSRYHDDIHWGRRRHHYDDDDDDDDDDWDDDWDDDDDHYYRRRRYRGRTWRTSILDPLGIASFIGK